MCRSPCGRGPITGGARHHRLGGFPVPVQVPGRKMVRLSSAAGLAAHRANALLCVCVRSSGTVERPALPDPRCRICPYACSADLLRHPLCLYAAHPDSVEIAGRRCGLSRRRVHRCGSCLPPAAGVGDKTAFRMVLPVFPVCGYRPARPAMDWHCPTRRGVRPDGNAGVPGGRVAAADHVYSSSAVAA